MYDIIAKVAIVYMAIDIVASIIIIRRIGIREAIARFRYFREIL